MYGVLITPQQGSLSVCIPQLKAIEMQLAFGDKRIRLLPLLFTRNVRP